MLILKRNTLVTPIRGPKGGYTLARHPADISLLEIFTALEGPESLVYCVDCSNCPESNYCTSRDVLKLLGETIANALMPLTLESIVKWQTLKLGKSGNLGAKTKLSPKI